MNKQTNKQNKTKQQQHKILTNIVLEGVQRFVYIFWM